MPTTAVPIGVAARGALHDIAAFGIEDGNSQPPERATTAGWIPQAFFLLKNNALSFSISSTPFPA
jgi:hypothetical protein